MEEIVVKLQQWLESIGASPHAVSWVGERTLPQAWTDCKDATWLMWLCTKMCGRGGWPDRKDIARAACAAARLAVDEDEPQWRKDANDVLRITETCCDGSADHVDVQMAARIGVGVRHLSYACDSARCASFAVFDPPYAFAAIVFAIEALAFGRGRRYHENILWHHQELQEAHKRVLGVLRERLWHGEI